MDIIDVNTNFGFYRFKKLDTSVGKILSEMDKWKISRALAVSMRGTYYDYSDGNDETLKTCETEKRFIPVATIDVRKSPDFEKDLDSFVKRGFKAVRLYPEEQGWGVDQIAFRKLLNIVNDFRMPMIISAPPGKLYDIAADTTVPIIFLSTHYYDLYEIIRVFEDRKNFYAEERLFTSNDAIELFVGRISPRRLVFGSNNPFEYIGSSVVRIESAEITEKEKELIYSGNVKEILNIAG